MESGGISVLGELLRLQRERRGWTQEELAARAGSGLSVDTISNIERGRSRPRPHTLHEVMAALQLSEAERAEVLDSWHAAGGSRPARKARRTANTPARPSGGGMPLEALGNTAPMPTEDRERALDRAARRWSPAPSGEGLAGPVELSTDPGRLIRVMAAGDGMPSNAPLSPDAMGPLADLPAQPTPFVGRERELSVLVERLHDPDVRLLTLTGPGGTGKTRLALQVASRMQDAFPDGAVFVSLASLTDPDLVMAVIAGTLGLKEGAEDAMVGRLSGYLRDRQMLLILDNFEHLLEAAPAVAELVLACPKVTVLVTSRSLLHLAAEHAYAVSPLSTPDLSRPVQIESLTQHDAVALFLRRAQAARADFDLTEENASAVAEICCRLDGLPLAIELAAARVRLFSPQALLGRLSRRMEVLTGGARDQPARHQTLAGALDWSHELLGAPEQRLFARLAAFAGGCALSAAESVCSFGDDPQLDVLQAAAALIDQSMLQQAGAIGGEPRLVMLETVREYALDRLEESGEAEVVRRRHAEHYGALAESLQPELWESEPAGAVERLAAEYGNLQAALRWMLEANEVALGLRLATALGRLWELGGAPLNDGRRWLNAFLADDVRDGGAPAALRARALTTAGTLARVVRDMRDATSRLEESLPLLRGLGEYRDLGTALRRLSELAIHQARPEDAALWSDQALVLAREQGDTSRIAWALLELARVEMLRGGELERRRRLGQESLELFQELGDSAGMIGAIEILGNVAQNAGDTEQARELFEEAVALARQVGAQVDIRAELASLALTARSRGWYERSIALYLDCRDRSLAVGDRREAARMQCACARSMGERGDYQGAEELLAESLVVFREDREQWGVALALSILGSVAGDLGDAARAEEFCEEALTLFRQLGDVGSAGSCLRKLAQAAHYRGDYRRAEALLEESLALFRELGHPAPLAKALTAMGQVRLDAGDDRRAEGAFVESLTLGGVGGARQVIATGLEGMAGGAVRRGQFERAVRLFGAAGAIRAAIGAVIPPASKRRYERYLEAARAGLAREQFDASWEEGMAMTISQALAYAVEEAAASPST